MKNFYKVSLIKNDGKPLTARKVSRNSLCGCGSGKKAKRCCGARTKYYVPKDKEESL